MKPKHDSPWASGPAEILKHAVGLLEKDSDANRRIAMILIDNAVEQAIKTYLSLPRRVTGINVPRRQLAEISESFPALLDSIEEHAADKLEGCHRLRNELYHQGFGLTVERDKVEVYAELAQILYRNLFGHDLHLKVGSDVERVGRFLERWNYLESLLSSAAADHVLEPPRRITNSVIILQGADVLSHEEAAAVDELRNIRNQVAHAHGDYRRLLTDAVFNQLGGLVSAMEEAEGIKPYR